MGFLSHADQPALEPIEFNYSVPGFETTAVTLAVPRAGSEIAEHYFVLRSTAHSFGQLRLEFEPSQVIDSAALASIWLAPHSVELVSLADESVGYAIAVSRIGPTMEISGIPSGSYRARFLAGNGRWVFPLEGLPLLIGSGPAVFRVPTQDMGALVLDAEQYDASSIATAARILITPKGRKVSAQFAFVAPPYYIQGLRPGIYECTIFAQTREGAERSKAIGPLEVSASKTTVAAFAW